MKSKLELLLVLGDSSADQMYEKKTEEYNFGLVCIVHMQNLCAQFISILHCNFGSDTMCYGFKAMKPTTSWKKESDQ